MPKPKVSRKSLLSILNEAAFDPRADGPLSIVVALNDPSYCEMKAIELITEARQVINKYAVPLSETFIHYHNRMTQAMGLLALARFQRGQIQAEIENRAGSQDSSGT